MNNPTTATPHPTATAAAAATTTTSTAKSTTLEPKPKENRNSIDQLINNYERTTTSSTAIILPSTQPSPQKPTIPPNENHNNRATASPNPEQQERLLHSSSTHSHPSATTTPHAAYVLLAEFDIDTGSGLKHQYPSPTGTAEHVLADLMLPDGAHDRNEDWTVFFLNQTPRLTVTNDCHLSNQPQSTPTPHYQQQHLSSLESNPSIQQPTPNKTDNKLLYVISLVRTKKDTSVRRGAICKAMAVCSYYPYIQIFKPILLLALEDYFVNPSIDCLARLFHAINTMDTSGLPDLTYHERLILRCSERQDMFEEKFTSSSGENRELADGPLSTIASSHSQNNLSLPSSNFPAFYNPQSSTGAKVSFPDSSPGTPLLPSSSSFISFDTRSIYSNPPHQRTSSGSYSNASSVESPGKPTSHHAFKGSHSRTTSNLGSHLQSSSSQSNQQTPLYTSNNSTLNHYRTPSQKRPRDTHFFDTKIEYAGKAIPVRIPLQTFPEEVGEYSLIKLIQTFSSPNALNPNGPFHPHLHSSGPFTHPIVFLFNALITQKRIVFLGHGLPAGHVSEMVLAACALGSGCGGVLEGFISRAFPYCNLTIYEDFKVVPGYIAGVTNPIFELHTDAWDVFCNIETGKITVSKDIAMPLHSIRPFSPAPPERSTTELTTSSGAVLGAIGNTPSSLSHKDDSHLLKSSNAMGSSKHEAAAKDSLDNLLMEDILQAIQAHFGESIIRARMMDYVRRFIRIGSRWEEDQYGTSGIGIKTLSFKVLPTLRSRTSSSNNNTTSSNQSPNQKLNSSSRSQLINDKIRFLGSGAVFVDDEVAHKKELLLNSSRIEGWRETDSYQILKKKFELGGETHFGFDISHQISRLRMSRKMPEVEVETIYEVLVNTIETDEQVVEVLSWLPSYLGGLLPLSFGLFHPSKKIRSLSVELIRKFEAHPIGQKFFKSLNHFNKLAYQRLAHYQLVLPFLHHQQQHQQHQQQQHHLHERENHEIVDKSNVPLFNHFHHLSFNSSSFPASSASSISSISRHPSIIRARSSSANTEAESFLDF
ncbi:hypothetical protein PGT21_010064 [Puccinia graminis f. sp. tritici]|uniref:UDENN domain-containing protein n=3 Tax=Puccinia graminis f. sp. tritici TaxID=56615 RepID=A0A5B0NXZ9_PUCGR|nr:hypothetical protein PGT21_010064 [Puccinia graminis f. sp. tritici]